MEGKAKLKGSKHSITTAVRLLLCTAELCVKFSCLTLSVCVCVCVCVCVRESFTYLP